MTNQIEIACWRPPDLTEKCSRIWLLFHVPTTDTVCLKSSGDLENIYWQSFCTKPAASVKITSDIVPHNSGHSFTGVQTDTNIEPAEYHLCHLKKKHRSNNPRNWIIGHLNINSFREKFEAVQSLLHGDLLIIFAISESKLDASLHFAHLKVTDVLLHRNHMDGHGGGTLHTEKLTSPSYVIGVLLLCHMDMFSRP